MSYDKRLPKAWEAINKNKSDILFKLDKGGFTGTADDLSKVVDDWKKSFKKIGNETTATNLKQKWETGNYISISGKNKWINIPSGVSNAFILTVDSIGGEYRSLTFRNFSSSKTFKCEQTNHIAESPVWTEWQEVFSTDNCPISKQTNGWCKLANGMLIQWGFIQLPGETYANDFVIKKAEISFPIVFSTDNARVFTMNNSYVEMYSSAAGVTANKFSLYQTNCIGRNLTANPLVYWMAIGY